MKKIVAYYALLGIDSHELNRLVNEAIREGWQPLGSVAYSTCENDNGLVQAVVKYDDEPGKKFGDERDEA